VTDESFVTGEPIASQEQAQEILAAGFAKANQQIGRFNLAIFGMTGVGKSTLVNSIFGVDLASTGVGQPVTKGSHLHRVTGNRMGVFDTEGLEIGRDSETILADLHQQIEDSQAGPLADQIHMVWYCVRATDRRFTDAEADFVRRICALGPPVLLVLTRTPLVAGAVPPDTQDLAHFMAGLRLPVHLGQVHYVNAQADEWSGTPAYGLAELLAATAHAAPLGVQRALDAAQRIDRKRKLAQANALVRDCAESLELKPLLHDVRRAWADVVAGTSIIYGLPRNQAINAALRSRELTAMHRLLYVSQAGVITAPLRYAYLGAARVTKAAGRTPRGKQTADWATQRLSGLKGRTGLKGRRRRTAAAIPPEATNPEGAQSGTAGQAPPVAGTADDAALPRRMGTGLAAGTVTLAVGESWVAVCDRAYQASYPQRPTMNPDVFAEQFSEELASRMSKPLLTWRRIATKPK
jgi:hypothetical protein